VLLEKAASRSVGSFGVYAPVKTRPSKIYPKLYIGTVETHSKVASPATSVENDDV
jgi:hypothetical protein